MINKLYTSLFISLVTLSLHAGVPAEGGSGGATGAGDGGDTTEARVDDK